MTTGQASASTHMFIADLSAARRSGSDPRLGRFHLSLGSFEDGELWINSTRVAKDADLLVVPILGCESADGFKEVDALEKFEPRWQQ